MPQDLKDTASLLGSRLCHDLISPLGAISNGLELLAMSGQESSPELALIRESVESANARIRFFRVAFGAASSGQLLARGEIVGILKAALSGGRMNVKWGPSHDPSRVEAKTAFLAILCGETALPQGGEILVSHDRDIWQFHIHGPRIRYEPELWDALTKGREITPSSAQVQFAMLADALTKLGHDAQVGHSESAISIRY